MGDITTLITGGMLMDPRENDLTRVNAGMSHTGMHHGGESRHVQPKDVIIVPAVSDEDAKAKYPDGWETVKPYLRRIKQPA